MEGKLLRLEAALREMGQVAIAFSGGVDSTFLLHSASKTLGQGKVIALHGISCLTATSVSNSAETIIHHFFADTVEYLPVRLNPLMWKDFVVNDEKRCYFCKKRMYQLFQMEMAKKGCHRRVDGTNVDDLQSIRPGFEAIRELKVRTPLLDAGLSKNDIRILAEQAGLTNHDLPANSCLATRIATGRAIEKNELAKIERAEDFLTGQGFSGCRIRPLTGYTHVEIKDIDIDKFSILTNRIAIQKELMAMGFGNVYLAIIGR